MVNVCFSLHTLCILLKIAISPECQLARHKIYIRRMTSTELAYTLYILSDALYMSLMLKIA